ncbi:MAG: hypothetical protein WAV78_24190, partial [Xanthobacteraceae bacterium]
MLYEEKKPVMLFDVTEGKIYAYPYKKFKKELNESGRMSLTKQYDDALRGDQFVIFIRDSQKKKLISYSLERPSKIGSDTRQYRIRRPGGGRKLTEEKDPTIVTALEQMLKDEVAGDPMTEQKWIRSSLQRLSERLADEGHQASS